MLSVPSGGAWLTALLQPRWRLAWIRREALGKSLDGYGGSCSDLACSTAWPFRLHVPAFLLVIVRGSPLLSSDRPLSTPSLWCLCVCFWPSLRAYFSITFVLSKMAAMDKDVMAKEETGWVQTKPVGSDSYSAEMQMQEMGVVSDKWKGTEADQHDMRMLGRSQVLRVSSVYALCLMKSLLTSIEAQLWFPVNFGLCSCPDLYMGNHLRVSHSLDVLPKGVCLISTVQTIAVRTHKRRHWRPFVGLHNRCHCQYFHIFKYSRDGFDVRASSHNSREKLIVNRSPTAGGQYHWVSEFSPRWCQKFLSYLTGMIHPSLQMNIGS